MLKAVLLDLDNTLVLFDELKYYQAYFKVLNSYFSNDFEPEELRKRVVDGTMALRHNSGGQTNRDCFLETFARGCEEKSPVLWQQFMAFYREAYDDIRVSVAVPQGLRRVLDTLRQSGLKLVIASNPIFPVIAQQKRMGWADIDPEWFDLFTHMENMHHVKPKPAYYRQTCELIGENPEHCLMVGNDPVNDMAAGKAGLKTFRTTDADAIDYSSLTLTDEQRQRDPASLPVPDFKGPLADVAGVVADLLG